MSCATESNEPLVTVVIPVHNGQDLLGRAIESVLAQSYRQLELIVVDDGSSDATQAIARRAAEDDPRVRVVVLENASGGPARPRNAGIAASSGELIALLDHDDVWFDDKLRLQVDRLAATTADVCYSRCTVEDVDTGEGADFHQRWVPWANRLPEGDIIDDLLRADVLPCSTVIFRRNVVERTGWFREDLPALEDYDLWLRASLGGASFCAVEDATAIYRWSMGNLSHSSSGGRAETVLRMWDGLADSYPHEHRVRAQSTAAREALVRSIVRSATGPGLVTLDRIRLMRRIPSLHPTRQTITGEVARLARSLVRRGRHAVRSRTERVSSMLHRPARRGAQSIAALAARFHVPPSWAGFRILANVPVRDYAAATPGCAVELLATEDRTIAPLPTELGDRELLPRVQGRWRRSFYDVSVRARRSPAVISIRDGRVVSTTGDWGLEHFAFVGPGTERLTMSGSRWLSGHRSALQDGTVQHAEHVVWPWESWYSNHFHWLLRHVPKLVTIQEQGCAEQLVLPADLRLDDVQLASARHLGLDLGTLPRMTTDVLHARQLMLIDLPDPHPALVESIRGAFAHLMRPQGARRLYVRRTQSGRRQLANEEAAWELLAGWGFESVAFEELTFEEKVGACSEASVIAGVHGAGLSNIVFCAPGAHLIEVIDPRYANPEYYELAAVSGVSYWMVIGQPAGEGQEWNYGDVRVDLAALNRVVEAVARTL